MHTGNKISYRNLLLDKKTKTIYATYSLDASVLTHILIYS